MGTEAGAMAERNSMEALAKLEYRQTLIINRISKLELAYLPNLDSEPSPISSDEADGDTVSRLSTILRTNAVNDFSFKRVPSDYYDWSLEARRDVLNAASVDHLCKSIVLVRFGIGFFFLQFRYVILYWRFRVRMLIAFRPFSLVTFGFEGMGRIGLMRGNVWIEWWRLLKCLSSWKNYFRVEQYGQWFCTIWNLLDARELKNVFQIFIEWLLEVDILNLNSTVIREQSVAYSLNLVFFFPFLSYNTVGEGQTFSASWKLKWIEPSIYVVLYSSPYVIILPM